jgi:hypothetical protein
MAAPHVTGLVSLILAEHPGFSPAQVSALLQQSARPFPSGSDCNTNICGAGIVDAYQALTLTTETPENFVYLPLVLKPSTGGAACVPDPAGDSENVADALRICSGQTVTGQVSRSGDLDDVFKITAAANQQITIALDGSGGEIDLYLYSPSATNIDADTPFASSKMAGNTEFIQTTVDTAGDWYVNVHSYTGSTDYTLAVMLETSGSGK